MGKTRFRWVGLLVSVAIVAGAATAYGDLSGDFSSPAAPVPGAAGSAIYLQMTGATTGRFTGPVKQHGFLGAINVLALDVPTTQPGTTPCNGIEFRKASDQTTPQIFQSQDTAETISSAVFSEVRSSTRAPTVEMKITATNASINSIHHVDSTTTGAYEDVILVPSHLRIEWMPSKHVTEYNCSPGP